MGDKVKVYRVYLDNKLLLTDGQHSFLLVEDGEPMSGGFAPADEEDCQIFEICREEAIRPLRNLDLTERESPCIIGEIHCNGFPKDCLVCESKFAFTGGVVSSLRA